MRLRTWPGSPRRLVGLVLLVTLAPSILLAVLGWRLFREDRDGELCALQDRRERAADLVVAALERGTQDIEKRLAQSDGFDSFSELDQTPDAAAVQIVADRLEARPVDRLAYVPALPPRADSADGVLEGGEVVEFQRKDPLFTHVGSDNSRTSSKPHAPIVGTSYAAKTRSAVKIDRPSIWAWATSNRSNGSRW